MKPQPTPQSLSATAAYNAALANGTAGPASTFRTVCQGCGEWVTSIWFVDQNGKRLGRCCAPEDKRDARK
jgi:hypothetical protein